MLGGDAVSDLNRESVLEELQGVPATYRALLDAATPEVVDRRTSGTRWTNREMFFHLLLGYGLVRMLLPLVRVVSRLPPWVGRGFAATLNAGAVPFHLVNYLGSVAGGHVLRLPWMAAMFERSCTALARRLRRERAGDLARGMPFPTRWDPFFTEQMSLLDVYHYPLQHFQFHRKQLTIGPIP